MENSNEIQLTKKEVRYAQTLNLYMKSMYSISSEDIILKLAQEVLDEETDDVPQLWVDILYAFSKSEPENMFNRKIRDLVYQKLIEMYKSNPSKFSKGLLAGLECWFQGLRAYIEIANIVRDVEPIEQLPEVKTRLYRIPIYSQILESIFSNFFRTLRDIIGAIEAKDYSSQTTLGNLKDLLKSRGLNKLFQFVDIDVRNAINHGGIIITPWETFFTYTSGKSKVKNQKQWTVRDPIGEVIYSFLGAGKSHFDDFIEGSFDDVGGIIIGFIKFFCNQPAVILNIIEDIQSDEYLANEYLCRLLSFPGWTCGNIDTSVIGSSSQLNIHFFVSESDHGQLFKHSLETAIIASQWIPNYKKYMVGYRHTRMLPGTVVFKKEELDAILESKSSPTDVAKNVIERKDCRLIFEASEEKIDLEVVKRHRYPLVDGVGWKLREIEDISLENHKRFRANLYIFNIETRFDVMKTVKSAIPKLKIIKNAPSPYIKIKHGSIQADAIFLQVFKKHSRRKNRVIQPSNTNFVCLAEWSIKNCPKLNKGGIPEVIWDKLDHYKIDKLKFSWNPNFR